jgi:hypothetical protein
MAEYDNGGANAIKGFNYQKSIVALIAVLHYLDDDDFQIYVESEDDIVVGMGGKKTYLQAKGGAMSLKSLIAQPDGKPSIIEKNLAHGNESDSSFKIVTPFFSNAGKHLTSVQAKILTEGAEVSSYSVTAVEEISRVLPSLSAFKLDNSRVAVTVFRANQKDALTYLKGIMADQGIPVDNSYGMATLKELCLQIDQRSELKVQTDQDYEKKKFTHNNLKTIFGHSKKMSLYEELLNKLNFPMQKMIEIKKRSVTIGAIYEAYITHSKSIISGLNLMDMTEQQVIDHVIDGTAYSEDVDELDKLTIAINAYGQVLFERSHIQ